MLRSEPPGWMGATTSHTISQSRRQCGGCGWLRGREKEQMGHFVTIRQYCLLTVPLFTFCTFSPKNIHIHRGCGCLGRPWMCCTWAVWSEKVPGRMPVRRWTRRGRPGALTWHFASNVSDGFQYCVLEGSYRVGSAGVMDGVEPTWRWRHNDVPTRFNFDFEGKIRYNLRLV